MPKTTAQTPHAHFCPEWDFAWIELGDPEFDACICFEMKDDEHHNKANSSECPMWTEQEGRDNA